MKYELCRRIKYGVAIAILAFAIAGCGGDTNASIPSVGAQTNSNSEYKQVTLPDGFTPWGVWEACGNGMDWGVFQATNNLENSSITQTGQQFKVPIDSDCSSTEEYVHTIEENCGVETYREGEQALNVGQTAQKLDKNVTAISALSGLSANQSAAFLDVPGSSCGSFDPNNSLHAGQ